MNRRAIQHHDVGIGCLPRNRHHEYEVVLGIVLLRIVDDEQRPREACSLLPDFVDVGVVDESAGAGRRKTRFK